MKNVLAVCWLAVCCAQAQYVGSKSCYGCHSSIYKTYQQTAMGRSMTLADDLKAGSLPNEATAGRFAVSHDNSGWRQSESEAGIFSISKQLRYVVGSGTNGLTFLVQQGNFLLQAPLSYYTKAGKWDLSPGYQNSDLGFNRVVPEECINCHAGRPSPAASGNGAYADPPFQELAIGCENCHGPGEEHVKSAGKRQGSLVNPAKLAPRLAENICLNCHQAGDGRLLQPGKAYSDFRPGQWLFDTAVVFNQPNQSQADLLQHHSAMQASRCFRASQGKLSCLTCHDPHVEPRATESVAYYKAKCLTCHKEQSCSLSFKTRLAQTPADDCAGCHMPKRPAEQISHSALTNHRIPARDNQPPPEISQPETDGLIIANPPGERPIHLQSTLLLRAYQTLSSRNATFSERYLKLLAELSRTQASDPFVQACLGHQSFTDNQMEQAANHLKQALSLNNAAIFLELGQSLAKLGQNAEAIDYLQKGNTLDPYNPVLEKTLILQYINAKSYVQARLLMEHYVATFPEDDFMRSLLARVSK